MCKHVTYTHSQVSSSSGNMFLFQCDANNNPSVIRTTYYHPVIQEMKKKLFHFLIFIYFYVLLIFMYNLFLSLIFSSKTLVFEIFCKFRKSLLTLLNFLLYSKFVLCEETNIFFIGFIYQYKNCFNWFYIPM